MDVLKLIVNYAPQDITVKKGKITREISAQRIISAVLAPLPNAPQVHTVVTVLVKLVQISVSYAHLAIGAGWEQRRPMCSQLGCIHRCQDL